MRAITIAEDRRLVLSELPEPVPRAGEVLVDVVAAGVNRADLAQAAGVYPPPPGASPLPGLEVSGRRRDTGEEVVALLAGGGYAEVVAVPEVQLLPAPPALPLAEAAGLIEVAATVVSNLVMEAGLRVWIEDGAAPEAGNGNGAENGGAQGIAGGAANGPAGPEGVDPTAASAGSGSGFGSHPGVERQTVLIHGGNGGIGSFAIQFASAMGARVLTTVGSDEAADAVRGLGAELAWNRRTTDVPRAVAEAGGADIILDVVGGPALDDNVRMLREFGRLVVIGTLGGSSGSLNVGRLMSKRARVIGTTVRSRAPHDKQRILRRTRELVWPLLDRGGIRLPVQARLPLAEAARAHEILATGGHLGKVILDISG